MSYGYYTTPDDDSPVGWAASRAGVIRQGEEQFEKHAAAFYGKKGGKGLLARIFGRAKKGRYKPTTKLERPGFLQGTNYWF